MKKRLIAKFWLAYLLPLWFTKDDAAFSFF
jgi:hypothetical protein